MSANVRCAGLPSQTDPGKGVPGCGWKGHRSKWAYWYLGETHVNTAKACPRCGGRVELIPLEVDQ